MRNTIAKVGEIVLRRQNMQHLAAVAALIVQAVWGLVPGLDAYAAASAGLTLGWRLFGPGGE